MPRFPSSTFQQILTPEALAFLVELERKFGPERLRLLDARKERQKRLDAGEKPDFLKETAQIRAGDWKVAPLPKDLLDRRIEITGPVDRKMVINALNSGASCYMADFEDSTAPTWANQLDGQRNLMDAVRRQITFDDRGSGKAYRLNEKTAVLLVRPRGWHLPEKHIKVDGRPMSGSLFDFGLYFFHNAKELVGARHRAVFLPAEARIASRGAAVERRVRVRAGRSSACPKGTIKATVLIETITAAFEMDEILYELRDHSAGLNCGRWDYIFSFIKKFARDPKAVMPDRASVTMTAHFLRSYSLLVIKTCHQRGVHAIGGMAAQIPIKNDPAANEAALAKVRADKEREATDGHDGTWVAHPALVPMAKEIFDRLMKEPNQIARQRQDVHVTAADLLAVPTGDITEAGLAVNISVGIAYIEAWLRGTGCVPLHNLMEDAATAEISRAQVWQWLKHGAHLKDGRRIDRQMCESIIDDLRSKQRAASGDGAFASGTFDSAAKLFEDLIFAEDFPEFLTLPAYELIASDW